MTVEDAEEFFKAVPSIRDKMSALMRVGLGYIKVGQSATTLSGGEAQRVKLSKELAKRSTGRTLYILDEPTTGLHFEDVRKLLEVLHELVEQGNTVIVIEHNLDVIKTADHIIDIGPEGGDGEAGRMIDEGEVELGGRVPVNVSGGLLSKGHPLGATGIANIYEVCTHLRGEAGERQVENARIGMTHVIGLGSACGIHILEKA